MWVNAYVDWDWTVDGMVFHCETDVPCHLFLRFGLTAPARLPVWRTIRGVRVRCGYRWKFRNWEEFEQVETGLSWHHTFYVTGWPCEQQGWWYLRGYTGIGWSGSQSLLYTDIRPCSADPFCPMSRILVTTTPTIARAGNHYTWWANGTWYVVVPNPNWIEVYKLVGGAFVHLDAARRPAAFGGVFRDCDSRLSVNGNYIHITYTWRNHFFPPDWVCYVTFSTITDTWGTAVYPTSVATNRPYHFKCSMARDSHDTVSIIFNQSAYLPCVTAYVSNYGGAWGFPIPFFTTSLNQTNRMSACCSHGDVFHGLAEAVNGRMLHNSRPRGGPNDGQFQFPFRISNVHRVSIDTLWEAPYIAYVDDHLELRWAYRYAGIWQDFPTAPLTLPHQVNIFTDPFPPHLRHIICTRWPARLQGLTSYLEGWYTWQPGETLQWGSLAATRNGPAVISVLGTRPQLPGWTYFRAFKIPYYFTP